MQPLAGVERRKVSALMMARKKETEKERERESESIA